MDDQSDTQRAATLDLLGLLAYAELSAFERLATEASKAPGLDERQVLATLAHTNYTNHMLLCERITGMGADPIAAMSHFTEPLDSFHANTPPRDWLEGLVKAYVGDGIASDFYRAVADVIGGETQRLVLEVTDNSGHERFVESQVRAALESDPSAAGRLSLWARRLVGEALTTAQHVAMENEGVTALVAGSGDQRDGYQQLAEISRVFASMMEAHAARMTVLGLNN